MAVGADPQGDLWALGAQPPDHAVEAQALLVRVVGRAEVGRVRPVRVDLQDRVGRRPIDDVHRPGDLAAGRSGGSRRLGSNVTASSTSRPPM